MRREGWWALLVLGVGGLAAGDRVFASYWDFPAAAGELPDAVRAYRAAGLPWTAADVAPPPIPESRNAASGLRAAVAALPKGGVSYEFRQHVESGEPAGDMSPFAPALRLAHAAATKPDLDEKRDWDSGRWARPSRAISLSDLSALLAIRAGIRARQGDDAAALGDLEDVRRLSGLERLRPTVGAVDAGTRDEAALLTGVDRCVVAAHEDPARLARYRRWLARGTPVPDLVRAMRGEAYLGLVELRNADRLGEGGGFEISMGLAGRGDVGPDGGAGPSPSMRREGLPEGVRPRARLARYLQLWTELVRTTDGLRAPLETIGRRADALVEREDAAKGMSHAVNLGGFPISSSFTRLNRLSKARWAVALAFTDALILHARTGRWPSALTTPDPLGTGSLRCRFDGGRFRLWSVGPNGRDDEGLLSREKGEGPRPDDIVAAYPPVPPSSAMPDPGPSDE